MSKFVGGGEWGGGGCSLRFEVRYVFLVLYVFEGSELVTINP